MAYYDIWSAEIRLWWSSPKRERPRCGATCRDGEPVPGPARVGQAPEPPGQRPLPDARRAFHRAEDSGGTPAHSAVEPRPFGLKATPRRQPDGRTKGGDREAGQGPRGNTTGVGALSPWEKRERGGRYYTRSRKVGGRIKREYIGGGVLGELAALTDELKRCHREKEAACWKEEQEQLEALVAPVEELCEAAETIARAALLAAGFKRHNRGEWRRRRVRGTNTED